MCVLVQMSGTGAYAPIACRLVTSLKCSTMTSAFMLIPIVIQKLQLDRANFPCTNFTPGTRTSAAQLGLACAACWEFISSLVINFNQYVSPGNHLVLHNDRYLTDEEKTSLKKSRVNWVNRKKKASVTTFAPIRRDDCVSTTSAIVLVQNRSATERHSSLPSHTHARASFQGSASEKGVVAGAEEDSKAAAMKTVPMSNMFQKTGRVPNIDLQPADRKHKKQHILNAEAREYVPMTSSPAQAQSGSPRGMLHPDSDLVGARARVNSSVQGGAYASVLSHRGSSSQGGRAGASRDPQVSVSQGVPARHMPKDVHNAADNVMDVDEDLQDHRRSQLHLNADASAGIAVLLYLLQLTRANFKEEKRKHPPCLFCASVLSM